MTVDSTFTKTICMYMLYLYIGVRRSTRSRGRGSLVCGRENVEKFKQHQF